MDCEETICSPVINRRRVTFGVADEEDDEIFIGPISDKERKKKKQIEKKLEKHRRRTFFFKPRSRYDSESESETEHKEEKPADPVTTSCSSEIILYEESNSESSCGNELAVNIILEQTEHTAGNEDVPSYEEASGNDDEINLPNTAQKTDEMEGLDEVTEKCVVRIQSAFRGFLARKECKKIRESIIALQIAIKFKNEIDRQKRSELFQSVIKGYLARKEYKEMIESAIIIQSIYRSYVARKELNQLRINMMQRILESESATTIQRVVRGFLIRKQYKQMKEQRDRSIIEIQSAVRGYLSRKQYVDTRKSIIKCQSYIRRFLAKKELSNLLYLHNITIIQSNFRGYLARMEYSELLDSKRKENERRVVICQSYIRSYLARRELSNLREIRRIEEEEKEINRRLVFESAVTKIQDHIRSINYRRFISDISNIRLNQINASIIIQRVWRGYQIRKQVNKYKKNIIKSQGLIRCYLSRKKLNLLKNERENILLEKERECQEATRRITESRLAFLIDDHIPVLQQPSMTNVLLPNLESVNGMLDVSFSEIDKEMEDFCKKWEKNVNLTLNEQVAMGISNPNQLEIDNKLKQLEKINENSEKLLSNLTKVSTISSNSTSNGTATPKKNRITSLSSSLKRTPSKSTPSKYGLSTTTPIKKATHTRSAVKSASKSTPKTSTSRLSSSTASTSNLSVAPLSFTDTENLPVNRQRTNSVGKSSNSGSSLSKTLTLPSSIPKIQQGPSKLNSTKRLVTPSSASSLTSSLTSSSSSLSTTLSSTSSSLSKLKLPAPRTEYFNRNFTRS